MTKDDILKMEAGRELDKLVAEKVMGQVWQGGNPIPNYDGRWPWPPPYSTDIAAAWEIVRILHYQWSMGYDPGGWGEFKIYCPGEDTDVWHVANFNHPKDAPLAICKVAILAVMNVGE